MTRLSNELSMTLMTVILGEVGFCLFCFLFLFCFVGFVSWFGLVRAFAMLRWNPGLRACVLSKRYATELHPQPYDGIQGSSKKRSITLQNGNQFRKESPKGTGTTRRPCVCAQPRAEEPVPPCCGRAPTRSVPGLPRVLSALDKAQRQIVEVVRPAGAVQHITDEPSLL